MAFLAVTAIIAGWCSHGYWMRLGHEKSEWARRFWPWLVQGLVFPWLIWTIFNLGWGSRLPPLVPEIIEAQRTKIPWLRLWATWSLIGAMLIVFHWAAITYCWLLARIFQNAPDKKEIVFNIAIFGFFSGAIAAILVYAFGWVYLGPGLCLALLPVVHFTIEFGDPPPARASYDKALGQLKRGKIEDAEWEVITQLEKSENDFDGWMLLAEVYAREYRNMEDAARVILDVCRQPEVQQIHISVACHKLADWQLEIGNNPLGARAALELLCRKIPGTHFAHMAQQRLRQIPTTFEEFDDAKKPRRIRLPSLRETSESSPPPSVTRQEAAAEANRLSEKLSTDPNDVAAREKLAIVLGEKLGKIPLAVEQLSLLGDLPDTTDEQKSKWLAQIASWEFSSDRNPENFQSTLRRLIREYPHTSHAFAAQRRLYLLEMDYTERQVHESPNPPSASHSRDSPPFSRSAKISGLRT